MTPTSPQLLYLLSYLASIFVYLFIFSASPTTDPQPAAAKSRVASAVHAVACVLALAVWGILYGADFDYANGLRVLTGVVMDPTDHLFSLFIASSAGYFTSDLFIMAYNKDAYDLLSVVHHLILIPSFLCGALFRVVVPLQFFFLMEELSTVFLNIRWFYRANKPVYELASQLFAVTFIFSRIIYGSGVYLFSVMTFASQGDVILTTGFLRVLWWVQLSLCTITRVLNFYWTALILQKICTPRKQKV